RAHRHVLQTGDVLLDLVGHRPPGRSGPFRRLPAQQHRSRRSDPVRPGSARQPGSTRGHHRQPLLGRRAQRDLPLRGRGRNRRRQPAAAHRLWRDRDHQRADLPRTLLRQPHRRRGRRPVHRRAGSCDRNRLTPTPGKTPSKGNTMYAPPGGGHPLARRRAPLSVFSAVAAVVMVATACGDDSGGSEEVNLRFSWWGADDRHATIQQVIENFEAENPDIRITGENTDWGSYWDRLATNTAADDAPDITMQEERYLREYGDRGALLDLNDLEELDQSGLDPLISDSGDLEGQTFGLATGVNAYSVLADPEAFDAAGVDMPDHETLTWADYVEIATEISENTDGEYVGVQSMSYNEAGFQIFA